MGSLAAGRAAHLESGLAVRRAAVGAQGGSSQLCQPTPKPLSEGHSQQEAPLLYNIRDRNGPADQLWAQTLGPPSTTPCGRAAPITYIQPYPLPLPSRPLSEWHEGGGGRKEAATTTT